MRLPSVKTIENSIADCREDAKKIRNLMETYYDRPRKLLKEVDKVLGAHGVEYLKPKEYNKNGDTGVYFVNMGYNYISTLCYDTKLDRIFISCCGDIIEKNPRRFL